MSSPTQSPTYFSIGSPDVHNRPAFGRVPLPSNVWTQVTGTGEQSVTVTLTGDEALVLFDWLARTSEAGEPVPFVDQAEQRVLWDLECTLESVLVQPFADHYAALLDAARDAVRDDVSG